MSTVTVGIKGREVRRRRCDEHPTEHHSFILGKTWQNCNHVQNYHQFLPMLAEATVKKEVAPIRTRGLRNPTSARKYKEAPYYPISNRQFLD
jgi:hypothetical protein